MIHPSYTELIDAINTNNEEDDNSLVLNSRYSLVLATSKRARQLIAGAKPLVENAAGKKPLAIAIAELYKGKVKILAGKGEDEELSLEETDVETQDVIETAEAGTDAVNENGDIALDDAGESAGTEADDGEAADSGTDGSTAGIEADSEAFDDIEDAEPESAAEPED